MSKIIKTPLRSGEPVVQLSAVGPDPMPVLKIEAVPLSRGTLLLGPSFGSFWECLYSPRSLILSVFYRQMSTA